MKTCLFTLINEACITEGCTVNRFPIVPCFIFSFGKTCLQLVVSFFFFAVPRVGLIQTSSLVDLMKLVIRRRLPLVPHSSSCSVAPWGQCSLFWNPDKLGSFCLKRESLLVALFSISRMCGFQVSFLSSLIPR